MITPKLNERSIIYRYRGVNWTIRIWQEGIWWYWAVGPQDGKEISEALATERARRWIKNGK